MRKVMRYRITSLVIEVYFRSKIQKRKSPKLLLPCKRTTEI